MPDAVPEAMRRAFTQVKNGRPRPVLVEFPVDVFQEDVPEPLELHARASDALRRPTRRPSPRWRAALVARRAAGHLRGPGRALRRRPGGSCASWPSCSRRR